MALKKYLCTHCGRRFEAEEREIVECPGCFWSTSVKPDSGSGAPQKTPSAAQSSLKPAAEKKPLKTALPAIPSGKILKGAAVVLMVIFLLWLVRGVFQSGLFSGHKKKSAEISAPVQDEGGKGGDEPASSQSLPSSAAMISADDQAVLSRRVEASLDEDPSPDLTRILSAQAAFQSGSMQKLPSKSWSEESYAQMVAEQERAYKVAFPRSYRNKLMELFKTQYLPGVAAFESGDLLGARNAWVSCLAFPMYSQDPMRHRGVALTMLRPFINDTLSKIGALNTMIVESQLRSREEEISRDYQAFRALVESRSWKEADAAAAALQKKIQGFEQSVTPDSSAPPYPESIRQIDRDIGVTLMDILTPPTPPIGNLVPISEDLRSKRAALEILIPENRAEQQRLYDEGMSLIQAGNLQGAGEVLGRVRFPAALAEDAAAKRAVILKVRNQNLDSARKTG